MVTCEHRNECLGSMKVSWPAEQVWTSQQGDYST
jgi:hypothetical protein